MINCIIANRKFRSNTEDVCVHRTAADAIGTDYHLLRAKLKFHLNSGKRSQKKKFHCLDRNKLNDPESFKAPPPPKNLSLLWIIQS